MSDETLEETAAPEEGQPAPEAVADETPSAEVPEQPQTEEAPEDGQPSLMSRMYAGKYSSAEDLERAYLESQREASRMAGELSVLKKNPTPQASVEPEHKKLEVQREQWAQYLRQPNLSDEQRWNAIDQVSRYDRAIAKAEATFEFEQKSTRQSAERTLEQQGAQILSKYQQELSNTQSPLYQAAAPIYQQMLAAGQPENDWTRAMAVSMAVNATGRDTKAAIVKDRGTLLKTLNAAAKKAVVAGAGGPAAVKSGAITAKDIDDMSDADFAKYERGLLGV